MVEIDKRLRFEERVDMPETGMTTLYFIGDKRLFKDITGKEPDDKCAGMTLSLEFPSNSTTLSNVSVDISPYQEEDDMVTDYDWEEIVLPEDEIKELMKAGGINA